jgi:hypothetical protein
LDDIPELEDLASKYTSNPLPDNFVSAAVIEQDNDVIAFGVLRNHLEGLLYATGRDRDKISSLKMLINQAVIDARQCKNIDSIYIYAQDGNFAKVLENKFGFRRALGIPMILDL